MSMLDRIRERGIGGNGGFNHGGGGPNPPYDDTPDDSFNFDKLVELYGEEKTKYQAEKEDEDAVSWLGSPFEWMKAIAPTSVGAFGRRLGARILDELGFESHEIPGNMAYLPEHDAKTIIKISTLWSQGIFKFSQIYPDRGYTHVMMVAMSPAKVEAWIVPLATLYPICDRQHDKKSENASRWIEFNHLEMPDWLKSYGGTIGEDNIEEGFLNGLMQKENEEDEGAYQGE